MKKKSGVKRMFGGGNPGMGMNRGMFGVNRGGFEARDVKPAAPAATAAKPVTPTPTATSTPAATASTPTPAASTPAPTPTATPNPLISAATSSSPPSQSTLMNATSNLLNNPTPTASTPIPSNLINTTNSIASAVGSPSPFSSSAQMKKGGKVASKKASKPVAKSSKPKAMKYARGGGIESRGKTRGRFV